LRENNVSKAKAFVMESLSKVPQYCPIIQDEILELSRLDDIDFDPRQYKYNLSPSYMEKYTESIIMRRKGNNMSSLLRAHRNYPKNLWIALELIRHLEDDKKIISVVGECFERSQDRRLAGGLLLLKNKESLLEVAEMITSKSKENIESLWFMCIIATELGQLSRVSSLMSKIMGSGMAKAAEISEFFVVNHTKFSHDIELMEEIVEFVAKNYENRDC
jgi:hypothetical protein